MREQLLSDLKNISEDIEINYEIIRTGMHSMETTDLSLFDENGKVDVFQVHHIPIIPDEEYPSRALHLGYHFKELIDIAITTTNIGENKLQLETVFRVSKSRLLLKTDFLSKRWEIEVNLGKDSTASDPNSKLKKFWKCVNERCGSGAIGIACASSVGACIADPTRISCGSVAVVCGGCVVSCVFHALK